MDIPGTARGGTRSRVLQSLGVTFTRMGGTHGTGRNRSSGALSPALKLLTAYSHGAQSAAQAQTACLPVLMTLWPPGCRRRQAQPKGGQPLAVLAADWRRAVHTPQPPHGGERSPRSTSAIEERHNAPGTVALPGKQYQIAVLQGARTAVVLPVQVRVDRLQRVRRMQMAHYLDALRRAVAPPPESVAPPFTGTPGPPTGAVTPPCLPSPQVCVQHECLSAEIRWCTKNSISESLCRCAYMVADHLQL